MRSAGRQFKELMASSVKRVDRFDAMKAHMTRAAEKVVPQAGQIVLAEAKNIITDKDFIVSGTLRRAGFVSRPETFASHGVGGGSDTTVRVTISFPLVYAPWIEFGKRKDPRFGTVYMRSKVPGFLHEAAVQSVDRVRSFMGASFASAMRAFR